jgi:hypothetical protein
MIAGATSAKSVSGVSETRFDWGDPFSSKIS